MQDSNDISNYFLWFKIKQIGKKAVVNGKSLDKIYLVFKLKFEYFDLYLKITSLILISYLKKYKQH